MLGIVVKGSVRPPALKLYTEQAAMRDIGQAGATGKHRKTHFLLYFFLFFFQFGTCPNSNSFCFVIFHIVLKNCIYDIYIIIYIVSFKAQRAHLRIVKQSCS